MDGARGGCATGVSILGDTDYLRLTIGYEMHIVPGFLSHP